MPTPGFSFSKTWTDAWSDRSFRWEFGATLPLLGVTLACLSAFLEYAEDRPGVVLHDPLLAHIDPINFTWLTFGLIYLSVFAGIWFLVSHPRVLVLTMQSYILMVATRILMMYSVPLEAPAGLIPLADPLVQFVGSGRVPTKDLFFSGHTSTLFLLYLSARRPALKTLFLACTIIVAIAVIWQHVHYTVDVLVAPFVAYGCFRLVTLVHERRSIQQPIHHA